MIVKNRDIPPLETFKSDIESFLGHPISESAAEAVEDFWKNWPLFDGLIEKNALSIKIDTDSLGESFPSYSHYHRWTGAGTAGVVIGLVTAWFHWQAGVSFILAGLGLHFLGSRIKLKDIRRFADDLIKTVIENSGDGGYVKLCSHYISGVITLSSGTGTARWPQPPSKVATEEPTRVAGD